MLAQMADPTRSTYIRFTTGMASLPDTLLQLCRPEARDSGGDQYAHEILMDPINIEKAIAFDWIEFLEDLLENAPLARIEQVVDDGKRVLNALYRRPLTPEQREQVSDQSRRLHSLYLELVF